MIRDSGFSNNRAIATGLGGSTSSGAVATVGSNLVTTRVKRPTGRSHPVLG